MGVETVTCKGIFPGGTCTASCSDGYQGESVFLLCRSESEGFVGDAPSCISTTTTTSTTTTITNGTDDTDEGVDLIASGSFRAANLIWMFFVLLIVDALA